MCIQALSFSIPYYLWKLAGLREVKRWVLIANSTEEQKQAKMIELIEDLYKKSYLGRLFFIYISCELLNLFHVSGMLT